MKYGINVEEAKELLCPFTKEKCVSTKCMSWIFIENSNNGNCKLIFTDLEGQV